MCIVSPTLLTVLTHSYRQYIYNIYIYIYIYLYHRIPVIPQSGRDHGETRQVFQTFLKSILNWLISKKDNGAFIRRPS